MKYSFDTEIKAPVDHVVKLFGKHENMKHWQTGLIEFKHISGEPGKTGSVTHLKYVIANRKIDMTETILSSKLPQEYIATFDSKGLQNKVRHCFIEQGEDLTLLRSEFEFKATGMMKMVAALMPGVFKNQSSTYMKNFKKFAESR